MMELRIRYVLAVCLTVMYAALPSCRKEPVPDDTVYPDVPMSVRMSSRVSSEEGTTARILFWDEENLDKVAADTGIPYYECELPGKINDYNEQSYPFETGQYYPALNTRVYAMGFAPASLTPVKEGNYGAWYLPYRNGEDTTALVSNSIVGSSVYVFRDPMEFRPATTRFEFRAIRTKNMEGNIYVRDITVGMPEGAVPNVLVWDEDGICYRAAYDGLLDKENGKVSDNPIEYRGNQLNTDTYSQLGVRYLALPYNSSSLDGITVRALLSYSQDFPEGDADVTWGRTWPDRAKGEAELSIRLKDKSGAYVTRVEPGESYLVTILFDNDIFTVYAEQQEWENGGNIPIPIIPPGKAV